MNQVYEARARLDDHRKQVDRISTHEINTPEREAQRLDIADKVYGEGAPRKERRLDIVMGLPGAGKSSVIVDRLKTEHGSFEMDSDIVKRRIPEYGDGIGADTVHQESSDIVDNYLIPATVVKGDNVVFPIVGKNIKTVRKYIKVFKDEGYNVFLHHVDIPVDESARRVVDRYTTERRFVDPEYVVTHVGLRPKENFAKLIEENIVDGYSEYDNYVPKGEQARLLRQSQEGPEAARPLRELQRRESRLGDQSPEGNSGGQAEVSARPESRTLEAELQAFKKHTDPGDVQASANRVKSMAQQMSKEDFSKAIRKHLTQDELDRLGKKLGC